MDINSPIPATGDVFIGLVPQNRAASEVSRLTKLEQKSNFDALFHKEQITIGI